MKLAPFPALPTIAETGTWYRAVRPHHVSTALATAHTVWIPGRFNSGRPGYPGFPILYLSEDPVTPLHEVGALVGSPLPGGVVIPVPGATWSIVNVNVSISAVVDLTDSTVLSAIDTSIQELTGDWKGYTFRAPSPISPPYWTNVPTQKFGHELSATGAVEGFFFYSARYPTKRNLAILRNNLLPSSSVVGVDPATGAPIPLT